MTQTQPTYQYGRPGAGYPGGYPPQAAPTQQNPQRYFSPNPQQGMSNISDLNSQTLNVTDQPYSQPGAPQDFPQRTGQAPFYVVGQQQQATQQQQQQPQPQAQPQSQPHPQPYPQDETSRIRSNSKPPPQLLQPASPPTQYTSHQPQTGHRPQSTYANPQELATTAYDPPQAQQPDSEYSASVYSQDDGFASSAHSNQQPPASQQQYIAYAPPQQSQPGGYDPPTPRPNAGFAPPATHMNASYPAVNSDARQSLPSQLAQPQYKPYQPPESSEGPQPGQPSAPPGAPQDYYRQNTAY